MTGEYTSATQTNRNAQSKSTAAPGIDREKAQRATRLLLDAIGENPDRGALAETWRWRVPELLETLIEGMRDQDKPTMRTFPTGNSELVVKTGIPLYSLCQHYLLPFHGTAHVAYRPDDAVVGLSN